MKKHASHIKTFSGKKFDYLKMDVNAINIEDIAQGLSNTCRWTGQVKFYSVAEHCCLVAKAMYKAGYSREVCLAGLLHDASEAYCADVPSPLKRLCTSYAQIERKTRKMIIKKYTGLSHTPPVVWDYDMKMLATEHKKFFPGKRPICEEKPLDGVHIRNWTPYVSKRAFLNMFSFLTYN